MTSFAFPHGFRSPALGAVLLLILPGFLTAGSNPPGFPPFAQKDFAPAGLGPREPELEIDYPGSATSRGVPQGSAMVSILIDAEGQVKDSVVTGYTDKVFGQALLERVPTLKFQAAKFKGIAVPSRFNLGYRFRPVIKDVNLTVMDSSRLLSDLGHEPGQVYSPVAENKLAAGLEFTNAVLPVLPTDYTPPDDKPVKVFVTFYVDEAGHVRAPNAESAASPRLIAGALDAVRQWTFKPPVVKGQPVLVFAGRAVKFIPLAK